MTPPRIHTASPYGRGMTEQEAVEDLTAQLEDEE